MILNKILLTFFMMLSVMLFTSSCRKYEDGPTFSLASKRGRVEGKWTVKSATLYSDGMSSDVTELAKSNFSMLEFTKDGEGFLYEDIYIRTFSWVFINKKETLVLTYDDNFETDYLDIRRLKKKELWVRINLEDDSYVDYHFEQ